jgi:hypothetical protein
MRHQLILPHIIPVAVRASLLHLEERLHTQYVTYVLWQKLYPPEQNRGMANDATALARWYKGSSLTLDSMASGMVRTHSADAPIGCCPGIVASSGRTPTYPVCDLCPVAKAVPAGAGFQTAWLMTLLHWLDGTRDHP